MTPFNWVKLHKEIASIAAIISLIVALVISLGWSIISPATNFKLHAAENKIQFEAINSHLNTLDSALFMHEETQNKILDSLIRSLEPLRVSACITISGRDAYLLRLNCMRVIERAKGE